VAIRQARFLTGAPLPGPLEHAVAQVAEVVPAVAEDRALADDVETARALVASGRLVPGAPRSWPLLAQPAVYGA
jgi:histidine ammonia-lyase